MPKGQRMAARCRELDPSSWRGQAKNNDEMAHAIAPLQQPLPRRGQDGVQRTQSAPSEEVRCSQFSQTDNDFFTLARANHNVIKKDRDKKHQHAFFVNQNGQPEMANKAVRLDPGAGTARLVNDLSIKKAKYLRGNDRNAPLFAALDLGTNNCRLLIASPTRPGYFKVIDAFSRIVRLGEGLSLTGYLSRDAMDRAIEALKICQKKLKTNRIKHQRLVATEACRSAANGVAFIDRVRAETGLELEIVDRETEARLAVSGCGTLVERDTKAIVLFDIGGGSSEIALIDVSKGRSPRLAEHITAWTSLPVGVVTLAERFGGKKVTPHVFKAMKFYVQQLLDNFPDRGKLGVLVKSRNFHLLGTSGTMTTLAGIFLDLEKYDRRRIDGIWMAGCDVTRMTQRLLSWDIKRRMANPCIGRDRADLVLAGCAILEAIRDIWPSERLRVADRGLREGILTELMSFHGAWRRQKGRRSTQNKAAVDPSR